MASLITNAPSVLDGSTLPDPGWSNNLFAGPYFAGSAWWAIQKQKSGNHSPLIYASTDGISWFIYQTVAFVPVASTFFWDPLGPSPGLITFAIKPTSGGSTFYLQDFDCATGTLGAAYGTSGGPTASSVNAGLTINRLSDGTVKLFIVKSDELFYSVNAVGVWTVVDTSITTNPGDAFSLRMLSSCTDRPVGGSAFLYRYQGGGTRHYIYQYLSSTNVLATEQEFSFTFPSSTGNAINRLYQGADNNIYASELTFDQGPTGSVGVGIWKLSGTLSAPTMTEILIHDFSLAGNNNTVFSFANEVTALPRILVTLQDNDLGGGQNVYIYELTFNGSTWSAPVLFIDLVAHPPTTPPPDTSNAPYYYIEGLSFVSSFSSGGGLGVLLALDVDNSGSPAETAFALVIPDGGGIPGMTGPGSGYVFEIEKGVGRLATFEE